MIEARRKTGLCAAHYSDTLRTVVEKPEKPEPRWPIKTVLVPQCTNILNDDFRFVSVNLPKAPWEKTA
jgi:hypothetical protein